MQGGILALDLATTTGWAYGRVPLDAARAKPLSGVIAIRGALTLGGFLSRFEDALLAKLVEFNPHGLIIEAPILPKACNRETSIKLMSLAGIAEMTAYNSGIRWREQAQPSSVKKHWTGRGNADKAAMMAEATRRGMTFVDDNECDAIAIWDFGCAMYRQQRGVSP